VRRIHYTGLADSQGLDASGGPYLMAQLMHIPELERVAHVLIFLSPDSRRGGGTPGSIRASYLWMGLRACAKAPAGPP